jgi:hypothetical protein
VIHTAPPHSDIAGFGVIDGEPLEGYDGVYTVDPFGNRLELLEPARH